MAIINSTDNNFARDTASGLVLIDFWAPWCGPCQIMGPILEELAKVMGDKVRILKHNVDNEPTTAGQFGIRSIPTMVIMKDGQPVDKVVGVRDVSELQDLLGRYL